MKLTRVRLTRSDEGQSLIFIGLGIGFFLFLIGAVVDASLIYMQKRDLQNAADAGALAGAQRLPGDTPGAIADAKTWAAKNVSGLTYNEAEVFDGNSSVRSTVKKPIPTILLGRFGFANREVTAKAAAKMVGGATGFGVIALHPSQCRSLLVDSNAQINVEGGGIFVNSTCEPDAMYIDSNSQANAPLISVTGEFSSGSNAKTSTAPLEGQDPIPDPFANLVPPVPPVTLAPAPSGPGSTSCSSGGELKVSSGNWTFRPGRYRCKVYIDSNAQATFRAGSYVFEGGFVGDSNSISTWEHGIYITMGEGFTLKNNARINGDRILLYNSCLTPCGNSGKIFIDSNAGFNVTPYGSPYSDVVIWQNRNSPTMLEFNSNSHGATGAIYAKAAHILFDSNTVNPVQLVASTIRFDSNARLDVNVGGLGTVGVPLGPLLIE